MANKHPNTSGLKPFNKMSPDEAKRIRRLASIARAKQRELTEDNVHYINLVAQHYKDEYDSVNAIQRIALDIFGQIYSCNTPVQEKIALFKFIQNELMKHNKYTDDYNALLYQTYAKKYQTANCYIDGIIDNDYADSINKDTTVAYERMVEEYKYEKHPELYNADDDVDNESEQTTDTHAAKTHSDKN